MRSNCVAVSDAVITDSETEQWFKGTYTVHPMMPSFKLLMWDFGSLTQTQEEDYIRAKLALMDNDLDDINTDLINGKNS